LRKDHAQKLIPTGKVLHAMFTAMPANSCSELVTRYEVHQLGEDGSSKMHAIVPSK
jgi:hypothetical protein